MNIKEWAAEDRPREKLYHKGAKQLTDAELLAIILSSGTRSVSALELAQGILAASKNDLDVLATQDIPTLCKIKGVGRAKATAIKAVMEMANRKGRKKVDRRRKITRAEDSFAELALHYRDLQVEEFWVLFLNRSNLVIGKLKAGVGGVAGVIVDPKPIYKMAVSLLATGIILSHNHPSGNLNPSAQDIKLTEKLRIAGKNLDITVFDHLIIANNRYYSFADEGRL